MDGFPLITWIGSQLGPAVDGNSGGSTDLGPTASGNGSRAGGKKTACAPPGAKGGWSGGRYYRIGGNRDGSPSRRASSQGEQPDGAAPRPSACRPAPCARVPLAAPRAKPPRPASRLALAAPPCRSSWRRSSSSGRYGSRRRSASLGRREGRRCRDAPR